MIQFRNLHELIYPDRELAYPVGLRPNEIRKTADSFCEHIKDIFPAREIHLICTGSSGALLSGAMSSIMEIEKIHYIYKGNESSHMMFAPDNIWIRAEYNSSDKAFIFVDDFIATGNTLNRAVNWLKNANPFMHYNAVMVTSMVNIHKLQESDMIIDHLFAERIQEIKPYKEYPVPMLTDNII